MSYPVTADQKRRKKITHFICLRTFYGIIIIENPILSTSTVFARRTPYATIFSFSVVVSNYFLGVITRIETLYPITYSPFCILFANSPVYILLRFLSVMWVKFLYLLNKFMRNHFINFKLWHAILCIFIGIQKWKYTYIFSDYKIRNTNWLP